MFLVRGQRTDASAIDGPPKITSEVGLPVPILLHCPKDKSTNNATTKDSDAHVEGSEFIQQFPP